IHLSLRLRILRQIDAVDILRCDLTECERRVSESTKYDLSTMGMTRKHKTNICLCKRFEVIRLVAHQDRRRIFRNAFIKRLDMMCGLTLYIFFDAGSIVIVNTKQIERLTVRFEFY